MAKVLVVDDDVLNVGRRGQLFPALPTLADTSQPGEPPSTVATATTLNWPAPHCVRVIDAAPRAENQEQTRTTESEEKIK
jgi:hypothetical protein